jgi:peptide/nickel transport system substrate-binding protein/oligopeptide transport system substrate-binding protein
MATRPMVANTASSQEEVLRMKSKWPTSRTLVAAATLVALAAATVSPATAQRAAGSAHAGSGVLVIPEYISELWPRNIDPAQVEDTQSAAITQLVYSGLVKLNGSLKVVPDLAAAMPTISNHGLTYTFKLRPDAMFSDGTKVTAQDVVYSITRCLSPKEASPLATVYLGHVKGAIAFHAGKSTTLPGVQALDAQTVQITLDKPISFFLQTLTYPTSYIVKQSLAPGANVTTNQALNIGTGPFMFGRPWRFRQEMYFVPNPHWYNAGKMKINELDVPWISTEDAAYREYRSGQVPMAQVPTPYLASVHGLPDFHDNVQLGMDYIVLNQGKNAQCKPVSCAPFNDLHFRRALLYATDRHTINSKILHGSQSDLCGMVPLGIDGGDNADLCKLTPYDPARAKAELALARKDFGGKIPNDGNLTVIYFAGVEDVANEYTALQGMWSAVGININITATPYNNWVNLVSTNYTPAIESLWFDDYPDAQDFTENLLASSSPYDTGNYHNPKFDSLVAQAGVTPNGPDRTHLYVEAQALAIGDVATIVIGQTTLPYRWRSHIHGMAIIPGFNVPEPVNLDWTNASVD